MISMSNAGTRVLTIESKEENDKNVDMYIVENKGESNDDAFENMMNGNLDVYCRINISFTCNSITINQIDLDNIDVLTDYINKTLSPILGIRQINVIEMASDFVYLTFGNKGDEYKKLKNYINNTGIGNISQNEYITSKEYNDNLKAYTLGKKDMNCFYK